MNEQKYYPRYLRTRLLEALEDTPVILIHGPRQCGKTTLAQTLENYAYITFDDEVQLAAAHSDPVGFVADLPGRVILDEVQRAPEMFMTIKAAVDRDRRPGRFVLTGSANVLLAPKLSDSLAGRMEILRLHPLARCELEGSSGDFLEGLFAGEFPPGTYGRLGAKMAEHIVSGGYPAALTRRSERRRQEWYRAYLDALVQRDVREMARISRLDVMPRLLKLAAGQSAQLFNVSELASPFQLSRPTIRDYVTLLERIFLLDVLPPWNSNRLSRLIKTPKLHLGDTGLAASVLGVNATALYQERGLMGQLLENFVYQELRRQASWNEAGLRFHHLRNKDGHEVDMVIEREGREIAGVEVKAAATVSGRDFRALGKLKMALGDRFSSGVVIYDGEHVVRFSEKLYAVPIAALWA